ncbi:MAG TPA: helix-turn-helix transcriptional regulator [Candidatus Acidoferrales bacterium]|nr:helix-turn-helix transcriptional regulator [Candidatus Acidoferrales bacterium]
MFSGFCLRQVREKLGLTYREVEQASYELAERHGRPEFIVHISRLADFENSGVVPGLHKVFSLCSIYHLDFNEFCKWYDIPLVEMFGNGHGAPRTHIAGAPKMVRLPIHFDPGFDPKRTTCLTRMVESWGQFEAALLSNHRQYLYGYIGNEDHWMEPLLRPGALILIDPQRREVESGGWRNEAERPIYFVELHSGYRCCWCLLEKNRLLLQPHPLSPCAPEAHRYPDEAEIIGQVAGVSMRLVAE